MERMRNSVFVDATQTLLYHDHPSDHPSTGLVLMISYVYTCKRSINILVFINTSNLWETVPSDFVMTHCWRHPRTIIHTYIQTSVCVITNRRLSRMYHDIALFYIAFDDVLNVCSAAKTWTSAHLFTVKKSRLPRTLKSTYLLSLFPCSPVSLSRILLLPSETELNWFKIVKVIYIEINS